MKKRQAIIAAGVVTGALLLVVGAVLLHNALHTPESGPQQATQQSSADEVNIDAKEVLKLVNDVRVQHGLPALNENPQLDASAQAKCQDMLSKNYFEHVSPNGTKPSDFTKAQGYSYSYFGENQAVGYANSKDVVSGWVGSPEHLANIVKPEYVDTGVAYCAKGTLHYTVQHFANPQ